MGKTKWGYMLFRIPDQPLPEGGRKCVQEHEAPRSKSRRRSGIVRDRACAQCGASPITGYKFCSLACRHLAAKPSEPSTKLADFRAQQKAATYKTTCLQCEIEFSPGRVPSEKRAPVKYCSKACASRAQCKSSDHPSVAHDRALYRRWSMGHGRGLQTTKYHRWGKRARSPCLLCGKPVGVGRTRTFPAYSCSSCVGQVAAASRSVHRHTPAGKAARRSSKAARRAVERSITSEVFDPFEIFERDGWRCHLCRCRTPKRLRGTFEPMAPELDHIVPLGAGGHHTRANTACCCRACNGAKGARPLGQMRLIG